MIEFLFFLLLFFACSAFSGAFIYIEFFYKNEHKIYKQKYKILTAMLFFIFIFAIMDGGSYFRKLLDS